MKNKFFKIITVFALVLAFVALQAVPALAASTPTITVANVSGKAGDTVNVTVALSNNPGIVSMLLNIDFDDSALTLKSVQDAGVFGEAVHKPEMTNPYTLCWANDLATTNYTVNGTVATLVFEIKSDAQPGTYDISASYVKDNYDIFDKDANKVDFAVVNGAVTVEEPVVVLYGDCNGDDRIDAKDVLVLRKYLSKWDVTLNEANSDCNADGRIDAKDVLILRKYLSKWDVTLGK